MICLLKAIKLIIETLVGKDFYKVPPQTLDRQTLDTVNPDRQTVDTTNPRHN